MSPNDTKRNLRVPGRYLHGAGLALALLGSVLLLVGSVLAWARFTVFGVEISIPGVVGWGTVTGTIGILVLLKTRHWPLLSAVLGVVAWSIGATAQATVGKEVVTRLLKLQVQFEQINSRLAQAGLPGIEPFGRFSRRSDALGPGPIWTVWGGILLVGGGVMQFTGERLRRSCPYCKRLWKADRDVNVAFCPHCGKSVGPPTACVRCQTPLAPTDRFCIACGEGVPSSSLP